ncbi:HEAT repeat domain-containing protein [Clostridium tyrobutyricum]|nr:HEAT repeat domain-containing protein [Clostridium tyrobutyricum]
MNKQTPANIDVLVKMAGDKNHCDKRLQALDELKKWDCQKSRDVITRLALHDRVYKVKEKAFRVAQALGIKKGGKPIYLGKKDTGYKSKDFKKIFSRIKRESHMDTLNLEVFKSKFIQINPEMYDVMLNEKNSKFDEWIEGIYRSLPKDKE